MKKIIVITLGLVCAFAINLASAQDSTEKPAKKAAPGQEQKALRKELTEKYDVNKTGRLDREERSKMTPEDLAKWYSISPADKARDEEAKAKADAKKKESQEKKADAKPKKDESKAKKDSAKE